MTRPVHHLTYLGVLIALVSMCFLLAASLPPKRMKGTYFFKTGVFSEGKTCRTDSAAGTVIRIDQDHENPLFPSKLPNRVHLLIWLKEGVHVGHRIHLPNPAVDVCYFEQGDLPMFHTTNAEGWIEVIKGDSNGKLSGKMDMKLVRPDHNMSNSDYHYMGGDFSLYRSDENPK